VLARGSAQGQSGVPASVSVPHDDPPAYVMRLAAPRLEVDAGLTFGGMGIDAYGRRAPGAPEKLSLQSRDVLVDVPGASAAAVRMEPPRGCR
jgi:hypothetical protein